MEAASALISATVSSSCNTRLICALRNRSARFGKKFASVWSQYFLTQDWLQLSDYERDRKKQGGREVLAHRVNAKAGKTRYTPPMPESKRAFASDESEAIALADPSSSAADPLSKAAPQSC